MTAAATTEPQTTPPNITFQETTTTKTMTTPAPLVITDAPTTANISSNASEAKGLTLFVISMSALLFIGSLTIIMTLLALCVYKKRQARGKSATQFPEYEMEVNPCYEASGMKQITDTEVQEMYVYEIIGGKEVNETKVN